MKNSENPPFYEQLFTGRGYQIFDWVTLLFKPMVEVLNESKRANAKF